MKYLPIALGAVMVAAVIFAAMWIGWRARSRRDRAVTGTAASLTGARIDHFSDIMYVSTTPVGEPLSRVAAPGLRYRGPADLEILDDGVRLQVRGEAAVSIPRAQLTGAGRASRRVGKAVEAGGLSLLLWDADGRALESSFRLGDASQQRRFAAALERFADPPPTLTSAPAAATDQPTASEETR